MITWPVAFCRRVLRAYSRRPPTVWVTHGLEGAIRRLRREQRRQGERMVDASVGRVA